MYIAFIFSFVKFRFIVLINSILSHFMKKARTATAVQTTVYGGCQLSYDPPPFGRSVLPLKALFSLSFADFHQDLLVLFQVGDQDGGGIAADFYPGVFIGAVCGDLLGFYFQVRGHWQQL